MKSHVTTEVVVTLVLSEEEATWLHEWTQNGQYEEHESEADRDMREKFFEATKP